MNSQLWTSYSTSHTLWGLSQRYLTFLRRNLTTEPYTGRRTWQFFTENCAQKRTINHVWMSITPKFEGPSRCSIWADCMKPPIYWKLLGYSPPENAKFDKMNHIRRLLYKMYKGWGSSTIRFVRESKGLPKRTWCNRCMCVNLSAKGPTVGAYQKLWPPLGAKFWGKPPISKLTTTGIKALCRFCKFDINQLC